MVADGSYHQTEAMIVIFAESENGDNGCQTTSHIRTVGVFNGSDSPELIKENLQSLLDQLAPLNDEGLVFDSEQQHCFGVYNTVKDRIVRDEGI